MPATTTAAPRSSAMATDAPVTAICCSAAPARSRPIATCRSTAGRRHHGQHGGYVTAERRQWRLSRERSALGPVRCNGPAPAASAPSVRPRTVDLGGAGATLTWGSGGFVPDRTTRCASAATARIPRSMWQNGIDLGAADRTINVNEGRPGFDNVKLAVNCNGVIQGAGGLILMGQAMWSCIALNTYGGTTWIGGISIGGHVTTCGFGSTRLADTGTASSLRRGRERRCSARHCGAAGLHRAAPPAPTARSRCTRRTPPSCICSTGAVAR